MRAPEVPLWDATSNNVLEPRFRPNFQIADHPKLTLLWSAFQRLANREQEDGTLVLCVW
jgi:hypothetical protein